MLLRSKIGKKKVLSESELKEHVKPQEGELLGRVIKLVGGDNIIVKCTDGKVRTWRIRGKIKRRMWIRDNDLVLVAQSADPGGTSHQGRRRRRGRG